MSANFQVFARSPSPEDVHFAPMQVDDLAEVMAIETDVYPHPWSRGNFLDSLYSGYYAATLRDHAGELVGYFMLMMAVDEAHLLNISVRRGLQGRGFGRLLLDRVVAVARKQGMATVLLEVRPSNTRACSVYHEYGFVEIGRRKGYYPAAGNVREDAVVMRFVL